MSRVDLGSWLVAVTLHAALLWGIKITSARNVAMITQPGDSMSVGFFEAGDAPNQPESAASEMPLPEVPQIAAVETPEPIPPIPMPILAKQLTPDSIAESAPVPIAQAAPSTAKTASTSRVGSSSGSTSRGTGNRIGNGSGAGKLGFGDNAHATWKNRVRPDYPASAQLAKKSGRVLVVLNVSAQGEATSGRISQSSGTPSLDAAALGAALASTYNPRRVAGVAVADTVVLPYTFQLAER